METFKVWYGGRRGTVNHLLNLGATIEHVDDNIINVGVEHPKMLRHVRDILVLSRPRTRMESALADALRKTYGIA